MHTATLHMIEMFHKMNFAASLSQQEHFWWDLGRSFVFLQPWRGKGNTLLSIFWMRRTSRLYTAWLDKHISIKGLSNIDYEHFYFAAVSFIATPF